MVLNIIFVVVPVTFNAYFEHSSIDKKNLYLQFLTHVLPSATMDLFCGDSRAVWSCSALSAAFVLIFVNESPSTASN